MGEYAPSAIKAMKDIVLPAYDSAKFSGILSGGSYGYHVSRNRLRSMGKYSDYSIQAAADKQGDGDAGSGIDFSFNDREMKIATRRLLDACLAKDPRLQGKMREFFGTLDGRKVTGYSPYRGRYVSADSSHLWHVHISIHRKYANDREVCRGIAEVLAGKDSKPVKPVNEWWHVDPKEVSTFLWGLKGGIDKNIQAKPGRNILVEHWIESNGRTWGVTDSDNWFAKEYLAKGKSNPPAGGGGGEKDMDKAEVVDILKEQGLYRYWRRLSRVGEQGLRAANEWHYLYITDANNVSLAAGPCEVHGHVAVKFTAAAGHSLYFRVVEDDIDSKGTGHRRTTYADHVEIAATSGETFASFPIDLSAGGPKKGWNDNLVRIQWHSSDPNAKINRAEVARTSTNER